MAITTNYIDNYNAATTGKFLKELQVAIVDIAGDIQAEAITGLSVPAGAPTSITQQELHNRRSALAYKSLHDPETYAKKFSTAISENLDLYADVGQTAAFRASTEAWPTKADIKNAVSACWNAFALNCKE